MEPKDQDNKKSSESPFVRRPMDAHRITSTFIFRTKKSRG